MDKDKLYIIGALFLVIAFFLVTVYLRSGAFD